MYTRGHSILELMIALTLMGVISVIGVGVVQNQSDQHNLKQDALILLHSIETAKSLALSTQGPTELIFNHESLVISSNQKKLVFRLSGKNQLKLSRFTRGAANNLNFAANGHTEFQNGTLLLHSPRGKEKRLIINQGGRIYLVDS